MEKRRVLAAAVREGFVRTKSTELLSPEDAANIKLIKDLMELMYDHPTSVELQKTACDGLVTLAATHAQMIVESGGVNAVTSAMTTCSTITVGSADLALSMQQKGCSAQCSFLDRILHLRMHWFPRLFA